METCETATECEWLPKFERVAGKMCPKASKIYNRPQFVPEIEMGILRQNMTSYIILQIKIQVSRDISLVFRKLPKCHV